MSMHGTDGPPGRRLETFLGQVGVVSPVAMVATLGLLAGDGPIRTFTDLGGEVVFFLLMLAMAFAFGAFIAMKANPEFEHTGSPKEMARGLYVLAPMWLVGTTARLALSILILGGLLGIFTHGWRYLLGG